MKKLIAAKAVAMIGAVTLAGAAPAVLSGAQKTTALSYQFDISRDKIPTMKTMYRIVDIISSLGYNEFQLYTEHVFKYKGHETAWRGYSPVTPEEIRSLDAYCASKGVELVPNQNSFGHLEKWLRHPEYAHLAQCSKRRNALNPTNSASVAFLESLYDQFLPCFRSRLFNVGCDEVAGVERDDYLDFLSKVHGLVKARGRTMMFWADIVLEYPEAIERVPSDAIALNWGYIASYDFEKTTSILKKSGLKFYVCPGTSGWCSLVGQTTNMLINVDKAVTAGQKNGAIGYMMADWCDGGGIQPWIVSIPGIVYLADRVKGIRHTRESLAGRIDEVLGCKVGEALMDVGVIDGLAGLRSGNDTVLWRMLRKGKSFGKLKETRPAGESGVSVERMNNVFKAWGEALAKADLSGAPEWVKDDFSQLHLLKKALEMRVRGEHEKVVSDIRPEYKRLWLKYYRPGGLESSMESNLSVTIPPGR